MAEKLSISLICMPDGTPAPYVMTQDELIQFLRIDGSDPHQTIRRYRAVAGLKAVMLGRCLRFRLDDVLTFLDRQQERNPR